MRTSFWARASLVAVVGGVFASTSTQSLGAQERVRMGDSSIVATIPPKSGLSRDQIQHAYEVVACMAESNRGMQVQRLQGDTSNVVYATDLRSLSAVQINSCPGKENFTMVQEEGSGTITPFDYVFTVKSDRPLTPDKVSRIRQVVGQFMSRPEPASEFLATVGSDSAHTLLNLEDWYKRHAGEPGGVPADSVKVEHANEQCGVKKVRDDKVAKPLCYQTNFIVTGQNESPAVYTLAWRTPAPAPTVAKKVVVAGPAPFCVRGLKGPLVCFGLPLALIAGGLCLAHIICPQHQQPAGCTEQFCKTVGAPPNRPPDLVSTNRRRGWGFGYSISF